MMHIFQRLSVQMDDRNLVTIQIQGSVVHG